MTNLFQKLWNDEAGFIVSAELVLVATILVIGMITGLVILRNQVVQELGDVAAAIGMISQGYAYGGIYKTNIAGTDGSVWDDRLDACQTATGEDVAGGPPSGIQIQVADVNNITVPITENEFED